MLIQELEKTFDLFLKTNGSSPVTRKNYLADLRHFLGWFILALKSRKVFFIDTDSYSLLQHLNPQVISNYSSFLISNKVAPSTVNRRLSTLRKFCKFALSQQLISYDPSKDIVNPEEELDSNDLETILRKFGQDLAGAGTTKLTIKNYLSDLRHFLGWLEDKAN